MSEPIHLNIISNFRRHPAAAITLASVAFLLLLFGAAIAAGKYPVAIVNGKILLASRFDNNYRAASVYIDNLAKSFEGQKEAMRRPTPAELEAGVLDQLVTAMLVEEAARREAGGDLSALVERKIGGLEITDEVKRGAETLYGMSFADFRAEVLVPQAERDILSGRLYLKGQDVDTWLAGARRDAKVSIFSSRLKWADGKVVAE
ncbi:MAG: hypothetical protein AAB759_00460 [Patescibacteria group bacterium]